VNTVAGGGTTPYTYQWSSGQTSQAIAVNTAGTYSVTVSDANQCSASYTIVIKTMDVSCGKDNNKVRICHNGKEICVAAEDVQEHLDHGDKLGSCTSDTSTSVALSPDRSAEQMLNKVVLYPNPVKDILMVKVEGLQTGAGVQVFNISGVMVSSQRLINSSQTLSLKGLPAGMYYVQVNNGTQRSTYKIIKE
jgi:hypothetical protein